MGPGLSPLQAESTVAVTGVSFAASVPRASVRFTCPSHRCLPPSDSLHRLSAAAPAASEAAARRSRKRPAASASPRATPCRRHVPRGPLLQILLLRLVAPVPLRPRYIKAARGRTGHRAPAQRQISRAGRFQGLERRSGDVEGPRGAPGQDGVPDASGVGAARAVLDGLARTYSLPTPCFSLSDSPLIFVLLLPFMFFVLSFWGWGSVLRGCSCSHPCLVL